MFIEIGAVCTILLVGYAVGLNCGRSKRRLLFDELTQVIAHKKMFKESYERVKDEYTKAAARCHELSESLLKATRKPTKKHRR